MPFKDSGETDRIFGNPAAGIHKNLSFHALWYSYATHLLEAGTDLRFIQLILVHSSSRMTEIYTHMSKHSLQQTKSPFDALGISGNPAIFDKPDGYQGYPTEKGMIGLSLSGV